MVAGGVRATSRGLAHLGLVAGLACGVLIGACGEDVSVTVSSSPTRTDVIEAVRKSVAGKTYPETVQTQVPVTRTCDEIDVDLDPYMPHNPELARCSFAGQTYVVWESRATQEVRSCPALPQADDPGWRVEERGEDGWQVSRDGSAWDVELLSGGAAGVPGISVSGFEFTIEADQAC